MVIRLPTASDPVAGIGVDGGPLSLVTIPGVPNAPSGPLCIGADLLDGVPQAGSGSLAITAVYVARGRDDATVAALRQLARDHLAPVVAPIAVTALTGAPRTLDVAPYVTADPTGMGVAVTLGALPAGLSASVAGTVVTYSSATDAVYSLPLTVTSLHGLAPSRTVTASLTLSSEATRWTNGYRWRARINLIPWNASGTITNFLLPFAEVHPDFRSVANGGRMESPEGRDFRLETAAGVKIPHVLLAYDPVIGLVAGFANIAARNIGVAEAGYAFVGKPGLTVSEEDPVGCRAGGWLLFGGGHSATDFSGQGRDWTTSTAVASGGRIGPWPAGTFDGATSYRSRTSSEMDGLAGITVVALVSSNEAVGRTQEFLNVAPADVADLALRLGSAGDWIGILDAGGQLQAVRSDTGLYYPGRGHAVALVWSSGARPVMYVDGALVDPDTPPAVATGTTAINETLELGRGNRPPGTASWWAGLIGPVLECNRGLTRPEIECLTAALAEPRLVYGLGSFKEVTTTAVPPVAQPVTVSVAPGATSAPIDVQAAAFNPDGLTLTTTVGTPTVGSASVATNGRVLASMPAGAASQVHRVPYTLTSGSMSSSSVITVRVQPAVTTPGGYDQSLPWGGRGIGAVCLFGQPGNTTIKSNNFQIIMMRAEHTGKINRVAWYNKFNLTTAGYHLGNGGQIKWRLRKITSAPGVRPIVLSDTWVETPTITNPVLRDSWSAALQAVGGPSNVGDSRFHEFPTQIFNSSLDVTAGDLLAFQQFQLNSSSGWISINQSYTTKRVDSDWSPFDYGEYSRVFNVGSLSSTGEEYYPELLYGYTDGMICGNCHIGYASGTASREEEVILIGGTAGILARQVIPMPAWANGKRVRRVRTMMVRYDNTTSADIRCRIRQAGSSADGSVLATATLAASGIRFETNIKGTREPLDPIPALAFDFGTEGPVMAGGTTYYVELSTTGGAGTTSYMGDRLQRYIDITPYGLKVPSGFSSGFRGERNAGSGWKSMATNGSQHDIPVWVEFG